MPRRTSARALNSPSSIPATSSPTPALPGPPLSPDVVQLRQQWKWAAFSQVFYTFAPLFNMEDVSLADIEDDLTCSMNLVLPRIMQRLLYTLTQDRKVSLDNWQTSLRKQYLKRDPLANPLGPEPSSASRDASANPSARSRRVSTEPKAEEGENVDHNLEPSRHASLSSEIINNEVTKADMSQDVPDSHGPHSELPDEEPEQQEQSRDWRDLTMLERLDSLHTLAEWHFHNPTRLRTIMKDDDEGAQWRIEPIGYDAKANAYWLIGEDRLWIQRVPPKPQRNLKRKRATGGAKPTKSEKKRKADQQRQSNKRQRLQVADPFDAPVTSSTDTYSSSRPTRPSTDAKGAGGKSVRTAKLNANIKLDAQAKQLAEYQQQAASVGTSRSGRTKASPSQPMGTRVSARLRGAIADEEWQPVPDEWLADSVPPKDQTTPKKSNGDGKDLLKTGLESGEESISDLTELSENSSGKDVTETVPVTDDAEDERHPDTILDDTAENADTPEDETSYVPEGFIEWETLCVTLYEWDRIAERFEKSNHYAEKNLYKILVHDVVPIVTGQLREVERKRRLEEAVVHRKRSSRIAIKESEKEEARAAAKKKAEEEEKLSRARRLEARLMKEEADRERRESAREQRRREREEREEMERKQQDTPIDVVGEGFKGPPHVHGVRVNGAVLGGSSASGSGTRTPIGEDWELDCEICHRQGINQDDGTPMMCCGSCSKWQHIGCHDRADLQAGLPKRNWDVEEFFCQRCRLKATSLLPQNAAQYYSQQQHGQSHASSRPRPSPDNYMNARPHQTNGYGQNQGVPLPKGTTPPHRPYPSHTAITFTHYQPQQHGFSTARTFQPENSRHVQTFRQGPAYQQVPLSTQSSSSQHISQYPNAIPNGSSGSSSFYHHAPEHQPSAVQSRHDNSQFVNTHWNRAPSHSQSYTSFNGSGDRATNVSAYGQPVNDFNYHEQYENVPQWQPAAMNPPPNQQQSQFRYHQSMGSTPYHPPS